MSHYEDDALDNAETKGARDPIIGEGRTRIEIVEVSDFPSRNPELRGAKVYRISGTVLSSTQPPNVEQHYPGQRVCVLFTHGIGSAGYDPKNGTSYGDVDIKGFLVALVQSTGTPPIERGWGKVSRGVTGPAQTAKGMQVDVVGFLKPSKEGKNYVRHRFEAVTGQAAFASALMAGDDTAPVASPKATVLTVPTAPRPPGPPAAPVAAHPNAAEVTDQAKVWARGGQSQEATLGGLLGWAVGLGMTDAQARAAIAAAY